MRGAILWSLLRVLLATVPEASGGGGGAIFYELVYSRESCNIDCKWWDWWKPGQQRLCRFPGGGGGAGTIFTNLPSLAGMNYSLVPGGAGAFVNGACPSINFGALAGNTNTVGPLTSRNLTHTPNAIPGMTVSPNFSVCSGLPITFTTNLVANNYNWSGPSLSSIVQNTLIASTSTLDTGIYTLTTSSLNGCISIVTFQASYGKSDTNRE